MAAVCKTGKAHVMVTRIETIVINITYTAVVVSAIITTTTATATTITTTISLLIISIIARTLCYHYCHLYQ